MRINQNVAAINAWRNLFKTDRSMNQVMERLSSGLRVNRAADDAAGLAISERMRAQIRGYNQAVRNAQDGVSLVQTAEGFLDEVHAMLQRMRELAVQSANGTYSSGDRANLQAEVVQLNGEISRIQDTATFNNVALFDGAFSVNLHVGPSSSAAEQINVAIASSLGGLLAVSAVDISSAGGALAAIDTIDTAIDALSTLRADLGAIQNRLEHTINNLSVAAENLTASESRIRDADMALEMVRFTRNQILIQSGTAMLAQANLKPQSVLQLLG